MTRTAVLDNPHAALTSKLRAANLVAALLVILAMALGGGGSPSPAPEMLLQFCALALLATWAFVGTTVLPEASRSAWLIAALILALPLVQLVPLPPVIWQALPGRDAERAALALVGAQDTWRPLSVAPARTLASFLALVPPAILLIMAAGLGRPGRSMLVAAVAGMGVFALLLGIVQMGGGEFDRFRFYVRDVGYLNGFQANHNSAADVLLVAMVAFAASVREWAERRKTRGHRGYRLSLVMGATVVFSLGVFLTASRAGVLLLPVAWAGVLAVVWPWLRFSRRQWVLIAVSGVAAVALAALVLRTNGMFAKVAGRFDFGGEFRPQLWHDALFAVREYFPFGAGLGSFVPVFMAVERLEVVDPSAPNRAHNDMLELLMESGLVGVAILAVIAAILMRRLLVSTKRPPVGSWPQVCTAASILAVIALHSQVDYPLRSMSLACIAALAAGLLMPAPSSAHGDERSA